MNCRKTCLTLIALIISLLSFSQLGETFDIERPEKYQDKQIGYEKTYTKKFGLPRKFIQNTISHYNFFFNANEKLKDIIAKAKELQKDTFDRLLQYYSFSLNDTKANLTDIDSVIQKASGGILLHDLRSNWVDNFYLLIGKAYLLRNDFDSAEMTFNYINYEYAPKTKDKDRILTGSRDNDLNDNSIYSISTKEKKNLKTKIFERPPSRNEAFLWMIRSSIENQDFGSAAGLIQTLKNDPVFPKRLYNDLDELTGYMYYRLQIYDSAAHYVAKSLSMHEGKNDRARREFLAGQLYELSNNPALSSEYYAKSVKHTLDPIMEVYARLYAIKLRKGDDPKIIADNIAALIKMGRKDAYTEYRDIIYYFAAQMELERKQTPEAKKYLLKSASYAGTNITQKNKSFLALADIAYAERNYRDASNYYDSIGLGDPSIKNTETIIARKEVLKQLVGLIENVEIEDSLLLIAKMSEGERNDFIKKVLRKLRKERGLKEEVSFGASNGGANNFPELTKPTNLFEPNSGEWYFYNTGIKTRGQNEFKRNWGNRPNIDGWRLSANISQASPTPVRNNNATSPVPENSKKNISDLTFENLLANIPLTDSAVLLSNDTIQSSLFAMAKLYQFDLEDIPMAIETYIILNNRFPKFKKTDELLYNLYLCYKKTGEEQKAAQIKNTIEKSFNGSKYNSILKDPSAISSANPEKAATKAYTEIYNLFLEGKFEQALSLKKVADSMFGTNNWTQQLLYIESVYYIKQRQDSLALVTLTNLVNLNATSVLGVKATTLSEVLRRRSAIEAELNRLQVIREKEDTITIDSPSVVINKTPVKPNADTIVKANKPPVVAPPLVVKTKDTVKTVIPVKPSKYIYKTDSLASQYIGLVLNKVDNIFINEARNSLIIYNRGTGRSLNVESTILDADNRILLIGNFTSANDAFSYLKNAQAKAATEIIPWLAKEKYSFILISDENLQLVMKDKNIQNFKSFLNETYPGKFQ